MNTYVYPYFYQNWNLFAPIPNSNYQLYARVDTENNGESIFEEVLTLHQSNRLKGYEPLLIGFSNCIHYFEKNTPLQNAINGPIQNDLNFDILKHAVKNYLQHKHKKKIGEVKLMLVVKEVADGKQRIYFN